MATRACGPRCRSWIDRSLRRRETDMRHPRRVVLLCLLAALAGAPLAYASGFGLFQHGGRAMGQAGAFTARASEPSALTFNPAGITRLDGFQLQAGLDFNNADDEYISDSGTFAANHVIQFPPSLYMTWKSRNSPFASRWKGTPMPTSTPSRRTPPSITPRPPGAGAPSTAAPSGSRATAAR